MPRGREREHDPETMATLYRSWHQARNERSPRLTGRIGKLENQVAANQAATYRDGPAFSEKPKFQPALTKATRHPERLHAIAQVSADKKQQPVKDDVVRCPACRRKIVDPSSNCVKHEGLLVHEKCFVCRTCGKYLCSHPPTAAILKPMILGKVAFTCSDCCSIAESGLTGRAEFTSRIAGERIVVKEVEHGNISKVVDKIGDDLEQAVYFMTPRCATCGGDLRQPHLGKIKTVGKTCYHKHCYETGRPRCDFPKPSVKLPPSFCAKYLPQQMIVKLSPSQDERSSKSLYFCWKNRENHAVELRQANLDVVIVPFVLDEKARANANYYPPKTNTMRDNGQAKIRKQPPSHTPVPPDLADVRLDLVAGSQVGPREPVMPKPASIIRSLTLANHLVLDAQLTYCHLGLEYCLGLQVPLTTQRTLDLPRATLSVKIEDPDRSSPHVSSAPAVNTKMKHCYFL